jgi:hypothetical protein
MPRVIQFPPHDPCQPDAGRLGQAWAAFAAEDAQASAPASLEARVLRAAQAALIEKRRAEAERRRHHWFAGLSALAASVLAATAWWLAGSQTMALRDSDAGAAPTAPSASAAVESTDDVVAAGGSGPVPMTNVEAGRVLQNGPRMLAARPLLDAADTGLVRAAAVPRAKSFLAPLVVPAAIPLSAANAPAGETPSDEATAEPGPYAVTSPDEKKTGHEVWTSRGFQGVFDPSSGQHAPTPPPQKKKDEPTPPPPPF